MPASYTPAAASFGRRIRIAYIAALVLLFVSRMWTVHGVHNFLELDAGHGKIVNFAGLLREQSTQVMHAAFVAVYAPQMSADRGVEGAIGAWVTQHAAVARLLAPVCAGEDALCTRFHGLESQMLDLSAQARASVRAPPAGRAAALEDLTRLQAAYGTAAGAWVEDLAMRFAADTKSQRHTLLLWALAQVLATLLVVVVVVEPVIRKLQRERSEGDRIADGRQELLDRMQKMGSQLPGMVYQYRLRPDGTAHMPYTSEGIREIYGLSPESVLEDAGAVRAMIHPDDAPRVREAIENSAAQLTPWRDEYRVRRADGVERWVLGNSTPERESDGSVLWHGFITDVTERRSAIQAVADARALLQSVLDAATEAAIIATDVDGVITVFNSGAERMLQYSSADLVGCPNPLVIHLETDGLSEPREINQQAEFSARECVYARRDGSRLTVNLSVTAIRDAGGNVTGYLSVATDVTERRQARDTLQAAKDAAERANRAKSEFVATMSHEIRTPMNGVLGFANLLRDTPLNEEQRDFLRNIEDSGQNLLGIINDILDFSKIEAGAMTLENIPFDLADAVGEVVALMAGKAEEKHLELGLSIMPNVPRRVIADPGRLKQILVNLVGNAIKFTSLGFVHVEVSAYGEGPRTGLRISVRDTGIGIAHAAQSALFQKFTQADASTTRRYGGTGLGLAICRQLVDLMGGTIGIDSTPGCGSTFWFSLPVQSSDAADAAAAPPEIAGRRVLIADDLEMNRRVLESELKGWGAECTCVGGGRQARAVLEQAWKAGRPFDVALLDHSMTDVDGAELGEMLHADPRFADLRLILLTSGENLGTARELLERGFCAYLAKPVVRSRLLRDAFKRALLPAERHAPAMIAPPSASAAAGSAGASLIRVLVAEDNSVNQMVAVRLLERLGCRVDVAGNGAEAVQMATRLPYGLVFMDCHMPEMDGFEAALEIRRRESELDLKPTPIVALTASVLQEDRDRCVSVGMDEVIGKPVQPAELAEVLRRFVPRHEGDRPSGECARPYKVETA
jgi:PAS domain S-box-containing protein